MGEQSPFLPEREEPPTEEATPWSFRILVAMAVVYLGWRLVQGVAWVVDRLAG